MNEFDCISLEVAEIRQRMAICFQTLAELARTSSDGCACTEAQASLDRVNEQVRSLAHLRSLLDRASAPSLTDHLREVAALWSQIGRDRGVAIETHLDWAPASPGYLAAPLAMIANTAVLNAFDHGYPGDRRGRVRIGLGGSVSGGLCLTVIDDGVGWDVDPAARPGRGCKLILDLAGSIGGRAEWRRHPMSGSLLSVLVMPPRRDRADAPIMALHQGYSTPGGRSGKAFPGDRSCAAIGQPRRASPPPSSLSATRHSPAPKGHECRSTILTSRPTRDASRIP